MGAWLAPVSQVLTHASASLRRLDHEAGITQGKPDAQGSATDVPIPFHNEGEW